jgi:hypothetical protein
MNNNNANERIVNSSIQQEEHLQSEDQTNLQTSNIRDYIIEAVALAYQAVQEDNGNENNLENSRGLYRECAERLEHIKPFVPEEHAKVLNKFSKIYRERAHGIKELLKDKEFTNVTSSASVTAGTVASAANSQASNSPTVQQDDPFKDYFSTTNVSTVFPPESHQSTTRTTIGKRGSLPHSMSQILTADNIFSSNSALISDNSSAEVNANAGSTSYSCKFVPPTFAIQFEEEELPAPPDLNPPEWAHRPFWLMMMLERTMSIGGHLTPGLYVPKYVWFQPGAKLFAQPAKIAFCQNLSSYLQELSAIDLNNTKLLVEGLDLFIERAEKEKSILAKHLPHNSSSASTVLGYDKKIASSGGSGASGELYTNATTASTGKYLSGKLFGFGKSLYKSVSGVVGSQKKEEIGDTYYVPCLILVLRQCQFLDDWLTWFEKSQGPKAAIDRIEKISFFFYFVVCQFVLQDLNILLERYMRKARESLSRLFPKDHKPIV